MLPFEKHMQYNGSNAHIRIPEEPQGLAFIAPGAAVSPNDPLIQSVRRACEDKGMATVVADLSQTQLITDDPNHVNGHFVTELKNIIDGYMADNEYTPDTFELIGHSMGGSAALMIAQDYPVSALTLLDPTPVSTETLEGIESPTTIIVSNVRSFKASGRRMASTLEDTGALTALHEIDTSTERNSGHRFVGATDAIEDIIRSQDIAPPAPTPPEDNLDKPEQ
tara:strand:- start:473 stop:1141 length:669 start_codon:yes stop_codon:yes gene_type:complete